MNEEASPVVPQVSAHILVVDDDAKLRELLRRYLTQQGFSVTLAADARAARAQLAVVLPDLLVLDIMLPRETGLAFTAALRADAEMAGLPILLLTARGEPRDRIEGLESGADDYLAKPFEPRELLLRIHAILRRAPRPIAEGRAIAASDGAENRVGSGRHLAGSLGGSLGGGPLCFGRWRYDEAREALTDGAAFVRLTAVEASLFRVLLTAPGVAFSREELAERSQLPINARSIDVQVTRLRRKLEDDPKMPRYLLTVRGEGYMLVPGEAA